MTRSIKTVKLNQLKMGVDGFNVRPLDEETVQRYQEVVDRLPPVEGWQDPDSGDLYLVDGRHRCEARRREGYDDVELVLFEGSRVDAEVRAFSANLPHPLPLTKLQRKRAIAEIVRRRYTRSNSWIAEEAGCSPQTVARIREELEAGGKIPVLDRFERKGGGTVPREYNRIQTEGKSDSLLGNTPDFFDEVEAAEKANREKPGVRPPDDLLSPEKPARDGGYDISEDGDDEEYEAAGPIITGLEPPDPQALARVREYSGGTSQHTLKFARLDTGGVPIEVIIYVDGKPYTVPVTLLLAEGAIYGVPETSLPDYQRSALVLSAEMARQMKLID
ncbi:MAG: hypothetical protein D6784_09265 [Chloroflexi bacterium]|nr:MAG: hypothetical protein D6784_09265 [Chloroflexota bacterium]